MPIMYMFINAFSRINKPIRQIDVRVRSDMNTTKTNNIQRVEKMTAGGIIKFIHNGNQVTQKSVYH